MALRGGSWKRTLVPKGQAAEAPEGRQGIEGFVTGTDGAWAEGSGREGLHTPNLPNSTVGLRDQIKGTMARPSLTNELCSHQPRNPNHNSGSNQPRVDMTRSPAAAFQTCVPSNSGPSGKSQIRSPHQSHSYSFHASTLQSGHTCSPPFPTSTISRSSACPAWSFCQIQVKVLTSC